MFPEVVSKVIDQQQELSLSQNLSCWEGICGCLLDSLHLVWLVRSFGGRQSPVLGFGTPAPRGSPPSSVTDSDPLPACSQFPHGSVARCLPGAPAWPQQPGCSGSPDGSVATWPAHWPVSPLSSPGPWLSFIKCKLSAGPKGLVDLGTGEFSQGNSTLWRRGMSKRFKDVG